MAGEKSTLHFEGTNQSQVFTDETGKTWTPSADNTHVRISTDQYTVGAASLYLDGAANISTPDHANFNFGVGNFTMEFRIRPDSVSAGSHIVYYHYSLDSYSPILILRSGANLLLYSSSGGGFPSWDTANGLLIGVLSAATWYKVKIVQDAAPISTIRYYLDDVLVGTISGKFAAQFPGPGSVYLGSSNTPNQFWDGYIDEFLLYDHTAVVDNPTVSVTVPVVPVVAGTTTVIAETPVSITRALTVPGIATAMNVDASAVVVDTRTYTEHGGLLKIPPTVMGRAMINDYVPQYWFPWGDNVIIDPPPDADSDYRLLLFMADYPRRELTQFYDSPDELPEEFHPCIVDFACYALSLKLKKWKHAAKFYNIYIEGLKKRKKDYIDRKAEKRAIHHIPDKVKYQNGQAWSH